MKSDRYNMYLLYSVYASEHLKKIWATAYTLWLWDTIISKILPYLFAYIFLNRKRVFWIIKRICIKTLSFFFFLANHVIFSSTQNIIKYSLKLWWYPSACKSEYFVFVMVAVGAEASRQTFPVYLFEIIKVVWTTKISKIICCLTQKTCTNLSKYLDLHWLEKVDLKLLQILHSEWDLIN